MYYATVFLVIIGFAFIFIGLYQISIAVQVIINFSKTTIYYITVCKSESYRTWLGSFFSLSQDWNQNIGQTEFSSWGSGENLLPGSLLLLPEICSCDGRTEALCSCSVDPCIFTKLDPSHTSTFWLPLLPAAGENCAEGLCDQDRPNWIISLSQSQLCQVV